jgi:hydroxymethylbilane synthase
VSSLRIGTRRSALALAQAQLVADALGGGELVEIVTAGDRGAPGGDKSRWVAELERALLDGDVDIAVHSAKDVPGELAEGLVIAAVPERADPRDALVGAESLEALPEGARVGTSSLRRMAQLRAAREDLEVISLRGNVDTRLRKLADGEVDALMLAAAGLVRLGRESEIGAALPCRVFVPAPGQGSLAVEARADDAAGVAEIDHPPSHDRLRAERAFSAAIGATCHTPVGVHRGRQGTMTGFAGLPDGSEWIRDTLPESDDPEAQGRELAERMLAVGAAELLRRAEAEAPA